MDITINNKEYQFSSGTHLSEILESLALQSQEGIAIAINEEVVPKSKWKGLEVQDNDAILIITATQGG